MAMTEGQNATLLRLKAQGYVEAPPKGGPPPSGSDIRVRGPDGKFYLIQSDGSLKEEK